MEDGLRPVGTPTQASGAVTAQCPFDHTSRPRVLLGNSCVVWPSSRIPDARDGHTPSTYRVHVYARPDAQSCLHGIPTPCTPPPQVLHTQHQPYE